MKKFFSIFLICFFLLSTFLFFMPIQTVYAAVYPYDGIIHADALGVHKTPDFSASSEVTQLVYGARVSVIGSSGNLYKVKYDGNKEGYVSKNFVTSVTANTLTSNISASDTYRTYCDNLKRGGFVESYCPYLYYLHSKYPKWQFKADVNNHTLEEASKSEEEKTSLQTSNSNYWYYKNGKPLINEPVKNGDDYYYINASTIASIMDPRNSLFEEQVFQFLHLEKTTNAMNSVALNTIVKGGNLSSYFNEFIQAGNTLGVNTLHLVARSIQEGANKRGYAPTKGTYTDDTGLKNLDGKTLNGFYNFYNIGTYQADGYSSPIHRGLAYAAGYIDGNSYGRPWNTPQKAITGGGEFISKAYIKNGQNTMHFQKFNVSTYSGSPHFAHQYMTNGHAPAQESATLYEAYSAGNLLNSSFEFVIPVYKNMDGNISQPIDKNGDSSLSDIKINGVSIFNGTNEYIYNLVTDSNTFTVVATPRNSKSTVTGSGNIIFVNDQAVVNLVVTAENGTKSTYKITVKKVLTASNVTVDSIVSKMAVKINGQFMYGIKPGTVVATLLNTVSNNKGSALIVDKNGKNKTSGNLATGDRITIRGTSENKTYIISVRGDVNGDGMVKINDLILVQSHILGKTKLTNEKLYAADVNYDSYVKINDLILVQSYILGKISL